MMRGNLILTSDRSDPDLWPNNPNVNMGHVSSQDGGGGIINTRSRTEHIYLYLQLFQTNDV